jgi:hypothetical protein
MVAIVVAYRGWRACWRTVRDGGTWAFAAAGVILVSTLSTVLWERSFQPGVDVDGAYFWHEVPATLGSLTRILGDLVGTFGWLDTQMPAAAYFVWAAMLVALVALGMAFAPSGRGRIVLGVVPVLVVMVIVLISAGLLRQNGFEIQGRHVLAFAAVLPLLAAEIVADGARTRRARRLWLLPALGVPALVVQAVGWYSNARRSAVGTAGPVWFVGRSRWSPPGTWSLWAAVVVLGLAAGVVAVWLASRASSEDAVYASPA